jgi:lambda family phage minor tail protein L
LSDLEQDVHEASFGEVVFLYQLDLTKIGDVVHYFTTSIDPAEGSLFFGGLEYSAVDILVDGFETSGRGTFPTPSFKIANITRALTGLVANGDDLVGCKLTRIRTLAKYLDNGISPNPHAHFPPDIFLVAQKVNSDKLQIEFQLQAAIDVEGQQLPNRKVLRNYCKRFYRAYNANNGTFDYTNAQCPYAGVACFDVYGQPTTPANDVCGKDQVGCKARFGSAPLPTWAFFGIGQFGGQS